jgi:hypothetical protein
MTALGSFPCYDVVFEISNFLNLDDVLHLSQTCRQLRALIFSNEQVARKVVAVSIADTYSQNKLTSTCRHTITTRTKLHPLV